ncbi:MAG: hypothetical protein QNJ91_09505 [Gammaproteobacteria bacterium]|nr:hypothetical protein [Gammaproteobacteria bacterium]
MESNPDLLAAHAAALQRWQRPCTGFASGNDPRTSDRALLGLTYGGLAHAAGHAWLNAGRRLIDKTYVAMLWHVQDLTALRTVSPERVAARLDGFITTTIRPRWDDLPTLGSDDGPALAATWVERMARECFGSVHSELAASRLLFYLLPMLPVFNLSAGHVKALAQLGDAPASTGYRAYAHTAMAAYRRVDAGLRQLPLPATTDGAGDPLIAGLLADTDWWPRRVFDCYLRACVDQRTGAPDPFACDDAGNPVAA